MIWTAMTILAFGSLIATNALHQDTTKEINAVPVKLMPPEGHVMLFKAMAEGAQIYVCKAKADDPDRLEWVLKAPDADLFDERGRRIGRHFAGPTWEALEDGSQVIGTQIEKTSAPKGGDIPWLLLKRKSGAGKGRFSRVTYIQRVDTEGGIAPARTCDKARQGQEVRVKYKATYVFYCAKE
ncbi:MAG TPA: DUF3455 domain-containing protein [Isosphaeraceae bacterium]|nr:DUF3455 domain-containing protein [Isosphaeraceae bacterium]